MTLICVPILADDPAAARRDAILAAERGADIIEYRADILMDADLSLSARIDRIKALVAGSPLPCIITCRPEWEGGFYTGDEDERVSMFEALGLAEHPPAYIDVELTAYTRSANIRQKINLAVDHPKQERSVHTRLILSTHDFEGRPADLTRRLLAMHAEPACAAVKVAYRARSIRDNLELFDILSERPKPTIALGMGEFGLMSRVLAPKFGGFLTFASLRDESATAPGQPTIDDLLTMYRFRSIGKDTKVYGVIGWPVAQSMSPLIHNAGFAEIGWDGVYVPMPVEGSYESFKATLLAMIEHRGLGFAGASVTIPHKGNLGSFTGEYNAQGDRPHSVLIVGPRGVPLNTVSMDGQANGVTMAKSCSTDTSAIHELLGGFHRRETPRIGIVGAGGVADAALRAAISLRAEIHIYNRSVDRARKLAESSGLEHPLTITPHTLGELAASSCGVYINCTPVGMAGGPDPDGMSIPVDQMPTLSPETVFFDTVYNPIETPMLRAARARGFRTIDGVQMFVRQAAGQFELWTGEPAPVELFDRLVRERLDGPVE